MTLPDISNSTINLMSKAHKKAHELLKTIRACARRIPLLRKIIRGLRNLKWSIPKKRLFIELRYGTLAASLQAKNQHMLKMPKSDLVEQTRSFWFNNVAGTMNIDGHAITREDIYLYGGPDPNLTHPVSQKMEWLSRIRQTNMFEPHDSSQSELCRIMCARQGDENWTQHHQNFNFALGCDNTLAAPKCLCILPPYPNRYWYPTYKVFQKPNCEQWMLVLKRRLARACQVDVAAEPLGIDWSKYDLVFMPNTARNFKFHRPDIPVILYGHEMWPDDAGFQWVIDWLQPDVLLVPNPTPWRENFRLPTRTKISFSPFAPSMFFTRPNPDPQCKKLDLLVIGNIAMPIYAPREKLDEQIRPLNNLYRIECSHHIGSQRFRSNGTTLQEGPYGPVRYLNQWSAYLGSARYVIFGRLDSRIHRFVLGKHYESLGSGAIPIFPEVPDLKLLGITPFEHYIPLDEVEGKNERLTYFLDNYDSYRYIAQNAVEWYANNIDRLLFDDFESIVHEITGRQFPKRLID